MLQLLCVKIHAFFPKQFDGEGGEAQRPTDDERDFERRLSTVELGKVNRRITGHLGNVLRRGSRHHDTIDTIPGLGDDALTSSTHTTGWKRCKRGRGVQNTKEPLFTVLHVCTHL